jgi:light-regulated signal transduction histidine kinase (bacteriophytochrome)
LRSKEVTPVPSDAVLHPAFGDADLSNCEREQIHLAGSIQPHGALLLFDEPGYVIRQASENAAGFLGASSELLGWPLDRLRGDLIERLRPHLAEPLDTLPVAIRCRVGKPLRDVDALVHRPASGGLVVEFENAGELVDVSDQIEDALQKILASSSRAALCDETARIFKRLTGYDRVMVYQFDEDGHGEVLSEEREPQFEPYLGNRYPATDIPQIARRLYERNRVRMLVDVGFTPAPILPRQSPVHRQDLDMSFCALRSSSPIHVQYLKNMGVAGTLVISIMVGGRLWGLISCHHYAPRFVQIEIRSACELLAEAVATRLAALESFVKAQAEQSARRLEQRMIETLSREGDWKSTLLEQSNLLLQPVRANGAALLLDGQIIMIGDVPGTRELRDVGKWLDEKTLMGLFATTSLGAGKAEFEAIKSVASGILAMPLSNSPGNYLVWFRPELIRTVTWGGDPQKPVIIGDNPAELSPRRSFAQWHQVMEGQSEPWNDADRAAAQLIGNFVADIVLQSSSVRMLIAQDQLHQVRSQVSSSDQPVIIADAVGQILLANGAFDRLLPIGHEAPKRLKDIAVFFAGSHAIDKKLHELVSNRRSWRDEVVIRKGHAEGKPLLIRADPIFSAPDRMLGFVLMFTDITGQKAAAIARRVFQNSILEQNRIASGLLSSKDDLVYQNLLSSVVENAQLAALEITDGADAARMPQMLESIRSSIVRATDVLKRLLWHAKPAP